MKRAHAPWFELGLCLFLALFGCSEISPTNPYDPRAPRTVQALGSLGGRVLNAESSRAVLDARVRVYDGAELFTEVCVDSGDASDGDSDAGLAANSTPIVAEATTNERGIFRVTDLSEGTYTICVSHPRYVGLKRTAIRVAIGEEVTLAEALQLLPGTGTVVAQLDLGDLALSSTQAQSALQAVSVTLSPLGDGDSNVSIGTPNVDGRVSFSRVPLGRWRLQFNHPDYLPVIEEFELAVIDEVIEVRGLIPIELEINPGVIQGKVVLEEPAENSMEGVSLKLLNIDGSEMPVTVSLVTAMGSEDYGIFNLSGDALKAGFYQLQISHSAYQYESKVMSPIEVRAGQTVDLGPIDLRYARGDISGSVSTSDGATLVRPFIELVGLVTLSQQSDSNGEYRFDGVRGGTYSLKVSQEGYFDQVIDNLIVEASGNTVVDQIVLQVNPGLIVGLILDEEGQPIDDARVTIEGGMSVFSGVDGSFRMEGLRAGIYTLTIAKSGFTSAVVLNQTVSPGMETEIGSVTLPHARSRIVGVVTTADGASPEGGVVRLSDGPTVQDLVLGVDGAFEFSSVRVGQYAVSVALADYQSIVVTAVDVTEETEGQVGVIELQIDGGEFHGTVLDESGDALADVLVAVGGGQTSLTSSDGAFTLSGLKAGSYALRFSKSGYEVLELSNQQLSAGNTVQLGNQRLMYLRGALFGTVTTEDAHSVEGAVIQLEDGPTDGDSILGEDGQFRFEGLREGDYSVRVSLEDYQVEIKTGITVSEAQEANVGDIELSIAPGAISGTVIDENGDGVENAAVTVIREDVVDNTTTIADGSFTVEGLRAGMYAVTITAEGVETRSLAGITVNADGISSLGTVMLSFERGSLTGTLTLEGQGGLDTATIIAEASFSDDIHVASVLADGSWSVQDVRTGAYSVTASAADYIAVTETVQIQADETTIWDQSLSIDYGCIIGTVVLSDGALNLTEVELSIVETGESLNAPNDVGQFTIDDIPPGQYTLRAALDGYENVDQSITLEAGVACVSSDAGHVLELVDRKAPGDVLLKLVQPEAAELPGFESTVNFVPFGAYSYTNGVLAPSADGQYLGYTLALDVSDTVSPLADLNFDPDSGEGYWEIALPVAERVATNQVNSADFFTSDNEASCFGGIADNANFKHCIFARQSGSNYLFTFLFAKRDEPGGDTYSYPQRRPPLNENVPIVVTAIDANGNRSQSGQIYVNLDTHSPRPMLDGDLSIVVPDAQCEASALTGVTKCYTARASATIIVTGNGLYDVKPHLLTGELEQSFLNFGCTYLMSTDLPQNLDLSAWSLDDLNACVYWNEEELPADCPLQPLSLGTEVCYGSKPVLSVTPTAPRSLYCLRGVDRAGQMSGVSCIELVSDDRAPDLFDAYPTNVNVRGPFATIYLTDSDGTLGEAFPHSLDTNFSRFEVRSEATGIHALPAECVDERCTQLRVPLLPGRTNSFEITAVDASGNRSEEVVVVLHENGNRGIASEEGAAGASPSVFGSRVAWAKSGQCEPTGIRGNLYGRYCEHEIQYMDEATELEEVFALNTVPQLAADTFDQFGNYASASEALGPLQTCLVACPLDSTGREFGTSTAAPLVQLAPNGVYVASYLEGRPSDALLGPPEKSHRLYYRSFGSDGVPAFDQAIKQSDDCVVEIDDNESGSTIVGLETNQTLLAYLRQTSETGYELFVRPQFANEADEQFSGVDECEQGAKLSWFRTSLPDGATPTKLGVIDASVYVITADNEVLLYTDTIRPNLPHSLWKLDSLSFLAAVEGLEGDFDLVGGAFSTNELFIVSRRPDEQERLYAIEHQGLPTLDLRQVDSNVAEGACNCDEDQACFERIRGVSDDASETRGLCTERLNTPGEIEQFSIKEECDALANPCANPDHECLGIPNDPSGQTWSQFCVPTCEASATCALGQGPGKTYQCRSRTSDHLVEGATIGQVVNHLCLNVKPDLELLAPNEQAASECDWCGSVEGMDIDGTTIVWTNRQQNLGYDTYGLVAAKLSPENNGILIPRVLVTPQVDPIEQVVALGNRVVYLDTKSGQRRVRSAEVSQQNWVGLSYGERHLKQKVKANAEVLLYSSFNDQPNAQSPTDGLYIVPMHADVPAQKLGVCTEVGQNCDSIEFVLPADSGENCALLPSEQQAEWQLGTGYDLDIGTAVVLARMSPECRDETLIFSATRTPPQQEQANGNLLEPWVPRAVSSPPGQGWDNVDLTQSKFHVSAGYRGQLIYSREGPRFSEVELEQFAESGCTGGSAPGYGVKLTDGSAVEENPTTVDLMFPRLSTTVENLPPVPLGNIDCNVLDVAYDISRDETHAVCAGFPIGCDPTSARVVDKVKQGVHYFRFRFDGNELQLIERTNLVAVVNPSKTDSTMWDCDLELDWQNDTESLSECGVLKLLRKGAIESVAVNPDGMVALEFVDGAVRTIALLDKGADDVWGYRPDSNPDDDDTRVLNDDDVSVVYTRIGENLGGLSMNRQALVFADERNTNQPEILRVSLTDRSIQRLTQNDRKQRYPAMTEDGVFFVDDRYSQTVGGYELTTPGITRRQLSTVCDGDYNQCPVGFTCVGTSLKAECLVNVTSDLEACDEADPQEGCPLGTICTTVEASQCLGVDQPDDFSCLVCQE